MQRLLIIIVLLLPGLLLGRQAPDKSKRGQPESLHKTAGSPRYAVLNIGNLTTWSRSDGQSNHSPNGDNGWYFPRNKGNVVYQDGIIWGAKAYLDASHTRPAPRQIVRVGGTSYSIGTRAGWVNGWGASATPIDPSHPAARIFRIRRDYYFMSRDELIRDAAEVYETFASSVTDEQVASVYAQYERDWNEWPVHLGAPYIERNGIPGYQPPPPFGPNFSPHDLARGNYDEPGVAGADRNLPADQVIWTVYNDLHTATTMAFQFSEPLGLEVQKTVWGYRNPGTFGNIYFNRYRFINKGGVDTDTAAGNQPGSFYLDSMFVCQWSDPDLGSYTDDLGGCDTLLQLGFVYNGKATDATYAGLRLPPPSVGYVLLHGVAVPSPGDTAVFDFRKRPGYRNLSMSSFGILAVGSPFWDPCNGGSPGYLCNTGQWWKILRGYAPVGLLNSPDVPYPHPPGANPFFTHSGNPVEGTGWIDGQGTTYSQPPGDRRFVINSGPFSLAPGDTQEIVVAGVAGLGSDRLSSITVMKSVAQLARRIHRDLFVVPRPPMQPKVGVTELNREIILEWGSDYGRAAWTEQTVIAGEYRFEGYNVYQLADERQSLTEAIKIATFDVRNGITSIIDDQFDPNTGRMVPVVLQRGTDAGVQRFISIKRDAFITDFGADDRLLNGKEYFFAVTAYNHAPGRSPRMLESDPVFIRAKPRIPFGVEFGSRYGDTLTVTRTAGSGDARVSAMIVVPTATTGSRYEIRLRSTPEGTVWDVVNRTKDSTVLAAVRSYNPDDVFPVVDGVLLQVLSVNENFKDFLIVANANGPLSPPSYGAFQVNNSGFPSELYPVGIVGTGDGKDRPAPNVGGARWGIHAGGVGTLFTYPTFVATVTANGSLWPRIVGYDWEIRFTAAGGYAFVPDLFRNPADSVGGTLISVPFELWRIGRNTPNDPGDDVRLLPYVRDVRGNGIFDLAGTDHSISGLDNDPETDWITWILPSNQTPGEAGYNALVLQIQSNPSSYRYLDGGSEVMRNMVLVNFNGGSVSDPSFPANVNQLIPETGQIFRIITTKPLAEGDVFSYSTPAMRRGLEVEKASARRVGVFPNPYYGGRDQETTRWRRFVTFNNLPPKVIIRIFNLAGHLVRTLRKDDPSQFLEWDLTNEEYWQVASGIYICFVEMPDLGETKVLKLAIIQPRIFRN